MPTTKTWLLFAAKRNNKPESVDWQPYMELTSTSTGQDVGVLLLRDEKEVYIIYS
jgi:hypothetical protein